MSLILCRLFGGKENMQKPSITFNVGLSGEIGVVFNEAVAFSIADVFG